MDSFKRSSLLLAISKIENLNQSTRQQYFRVIGTLLNRVGGINFGTSLPEIIEDLEKRIIEKSIVQATARTYKSALLYAIADASSRLIDSNESIDNNVDFYERVSNLKFSNLPKRSVNTSSLRYKHFPEELISSIERLASENNRFRKLREAFTFIKANNELGLRPIEWLEMNFFNYLDQGYINEHTNGKSDSSTLSVSVKNAKHSYGRSFGEYRQIIMYNVGHEKLSWITGFQTLLAKATVGKTGRDRIKAANNYFKLLQKSLHAAMETLDVPKNQRPTIYSTRHQCISNAKKNGLTPIQIAALFGHGSIQTAKKHYGKKRDGRTSFSIIPSKDSVEKVELIYQNKLNKVTSATPDNYAIRTAEILLNKS